MGVITVYLFLQKWYKLIAYAGNGENVKKLSFDIEKFVNKKFRYFPER